MSSKTTVPPSLADMIVAAINTAEAVQDDVTAGILRRVQQLYPRAHHIVRDMAATQLVREAAQHARHVQATPASIAALHAVAAYQWFLTWCDSGGDVDAEFLVKYHCTACVAAAQTRDPKAN